MITLLTALRHRSALRTALKGRDEASLRPILKWVIKYIGHPRHISLTTDVALMVIDLYADQFGESPEIDRLIYQMRQRVKSYAEVSYSSWSTLGQIDLLTANMD